MHPLSAHCSLRRIAQVCSSRNTNIARRACLPRRRPGRLVTAEGVQGPMAMHLPGAMSGSKGLARLMQSVPDAICGPHPCSRQLPEGAPKNRRPLAVGRTRIETGYWALQSTSVTRSQHGHNGRHGSTSQVAARPHHHLVHPPPRLKQQRHQTPRNFCNKRCRAGGPCNCCARTLSSAAACPLSSRLCFGHALSQ
jgi:hypothetical protein